MKKILAAAAAATMLLVPATTAVAACSTTKLLWTQRILLRLEGGECQTNGTIAASYNLYIVPTLVRVNGKWIPAENTEVRILQDRGGQACV